MSGPRPTFLAAIVLLSVPLLLAHGPGRTGPPRARSKEVAFRPKEIRAANQTSRGRGAIGPQAVTPRLVRKGLRRGETVLDFGAGKDAVHARALRRRGFAVTAHEFGDNVTPGVHDPDALSRTYDVVYASNVLNVQSSKGMLERTLAQVAGVVEADGRFIANYPESPRKARLDAAHVARMLGRHFAQIRQIGGSPSAPVWEARLPITRDALGEPVLLTEKGSRIRRDREHDLGKRMGSALYVHRTYEREVVPRALLSRARRKLPKDFAYEVVKYDRKSHRVSFIASPDWKSAPEPTVGDSVTVPPDGTVRRQRGGSKIWHHKWLFVRNNYPGFDVAASVARSRTWLALPGLDMARIQSARFWKERVLPRLRAAP